MICNFPQKSPDVVLLEGSLARSKSSSSNKTRSSRHFRTNSSSNSGVSSCSNKQQKPTLRSLLIDGQLAPWVDNVAGQITDLYKSIA